MQDLTVYLVDPSEADLDRLLDLYEAICPPGSTARYRITELEFWPEVSQPVLTASGRAAAAAGIPRPYFEPTRRRIHEGRAFDAMLWDGRSIDDTSGSWSFSCRQIHLRSTGLHAFVRILIPLTVDAAILRRAAIGLADSVEFHSGHGGLTFAYDPWLREAAFDAIYAQARRYWGIDVEDLNDTLPLMRNSIKGVNWLTLVGRDFASTPAVAKATMRLDNAAAVTVDPRRNGLVISAGSQPVIGDQHRPDGSLDPFMAVANALEPLLLTEHPDFPGERFVKNGNTLGWIRRFVEPKAWRSGQL